MHGQLSNMFMICSPLEANTIFYIRNIIRKKKKKRYYLERTRTLDTHLPLPMNANTHLGFFLLVCIRDLTNLLTGQFKICKPCKLGCQATTWDMVLQ